MKKIIYAAFIAFLPLIGFASGHTVTINPTNASCTPATPGPADGAATAIVSGGVGPFSYNWTAPMGYSATGQTITNLYPMTYTVVVTDSSDMSTATASVTITGPAAITISLDSSFTVCPGTCVTLTPSASGGAGSFTYFWTPAGTLSSLTVVAPTACPATSTTYSVIVSDANGCTASASTTVYIDALAVTAIPVNASACGVCDGAASAIASGGSAPYIYTWNPGGMTPAVVTGLCPADYDVAVMDANGCVTYDTVTVSNPVISANLTMVPDSTNAYNFWGFNASTGSAAGYGWDFGDGTTSSMPSPTHTYAIAGTYNVCLYAATSGGCGDTVCHPLTVTGALNSCNALFNIGDNVSSSDPNAYTITNLSYGATLSYLWDYGDGSSSTAQDPSHTYTTSTGPYQICLTVDNGAGCAQTFCDSIFSADSISRSLNPISFTVVEGPEFGLATGIDVNEITSSVKVFPNPFSESTTIIITSDKLSERYSFELKDVLGKTVRNLSTNEKQFSVSGNGLKSGMYFYSVSNEKETLGIGKVIIQ